MSTIKQITIEYRYTFNLGNYSNCQPAISFTAELSDGENVNDVILTLQTRARLAVETEIDYVLRQSGRAPYFEQLRDGAKDYREDF